LSEEERAEELPETYEVSGGQIQPVGEGEVECIHPALDFCEKGYVGVWRLCLVRRGARPRYKYVYFLITDSKDIIIGDHSRLAEAGIAIKYSPVRVDVEPRWSERGIREFLNGWEPSPEEVYNTVIRLLRKYIDFYDERLYHFFTLWIIGTYFFPLFNCYPYIFITGVKRVGKTKLLTVIKNLAFNAAMSSSMTAASVFRIVQNSRGTLLIDEIEQLASPEKMHEIRQLLTEGYKRGGVAYRTEKQSEERPTPVPFEVYSPKCLANIRGLDDILADRCFTVVMLRTRNREIANREINDRDPEWQVARDMLHAFTLTYWSEMKALTGTNIEVEDLYGRELELAKPIVVLANFFDLQGVHYEPSNREGLEQFTVVPLTTAMTQLVQTLVKYRRMEEVTETAEILLIKVLMKMVKEGGWYKVADIRQEMEGMLEEPEKWLKNQWVGRRLTNFGFREKRRVGRYSEYRLAPNKVEEIARRYLGPMYEEIKRELESGQRTLEE